jgi:acyl-CoA synthetase (AMP-forming)/AMP-acid ligase II
MYGQTEGGPVGTALRPGEIDTKPTSIGRAGTGPATTFGVVDEAGNEVPVGEVGEIVLSGPTLMRGYRNDPEATAQTLRGGRLHTGDMGRVDDDGYLFFVDRKKDMVIRGGYNVGTVEVENALLACPGVAEAAVIGVPHEILGEDLRAYVVLDRGSVDDVRRRLAAVLADYKTPRDIRVVPELPRNAMGKVSKAELRER